MNRNDNALARDMRNVVDDVEALLRDAGTAGSGTVSDLRSRVGYAMQVARDRLDTIDTNVRTGARRAGSGKAGRSGRWPRPTRRLRPDERRLD